jgi:hypothetical protein
MQRLEAAASVGGKPRRPCLASVSVVDAPAVRTRVSSSLGIRRSAKGRLGGAGGRGRPNRGQSWLVVDSM